MTCIVAIRDPATRTILVAADSRCSMGDSMLKTTLPKSNGKVFEVAGFVLGLTGNARIRHLASSLNVNFGKNGPNAKFDLETTLLDVIVPKLKELAKKYDFYEVKNGIPSLRGHMLIAFANQMCQIGDAFAVTPITGPYWAVGSGAYFALGSLFTSDHADTTVRERALKALAAASHFTDTVGPPFIVKETKSFREMRKDK